MTMILQQHACSLASDAALNAGLTLTCTLQASTHSTSRWSPDKTQCWSSSWLMELNQTCRWFDQRTFYFQSDVHLHSEDSLCSEYLVFQLTEWLCSGDDCRQNSNVLGCREVIAFDDNIFICCLLYFLTTASQESSRNNRDVALLRRKRQFSQL